jgi:hypothetical protein
VPIADDSRCGAVCLNDEGGGDLQPEDGYDFAGFGGLSDCGK